MRVSIKGNTEEIAALVLAVQERRKAISEREVPGNERELLIREYERRLALLKSGASPGDVIFKV